MDPTNIGIFNLAEKRLAWTDKRQDVLAQNIANANTPGWEARDLKPFAATLAGMASAASEPVRTNPGHLAGTTGGALLGLQAKPAQRAPDGNAVSMEEQLTKVADTDTAQALTMNLYKKYLGLFRIAIGKA
jgi:flagellar basal-body rod protein FlgB